MLKYNNQSRLTILLSNTFLYYFSFFEDRLTGAVMSKVCLLHKFVFVQLQCVCVGRGGGGHWGKGEPCNCDLVLEGPSFVTDLNYFFPPCIPGIGLNIL